MLLNILPTLILAATITALAAAHPHAGSNPSHQPIRAPATEASITGGAKVCTGPNFTGNCYLALDCVGKCYVWMTTWQWADSFVSDPDFNCYLHSEPYCNGDNVLVPDGGFSDLRAVGWLDRLESFSCLFAYEPVGNAKNGNATAKLPLVVTPIGPGLSAANITHINATSTHHHAAATRDTGGVEKRDPGNVYICSGVGFTGSCSVATTTLGTCFNMLEWRTPVAAFGPDPYATCYIFHGYECDDDVTTGIEYPGLPDVQNDGFPYTIGSWYCEHDGAHLANEDDAVAIGAVHLSTTVVLPAPTAVAIVDTTAQNGTYGNISISARTIRNARRDNPGGCYICSEPNWAGDCGYVVPEITTCYGMWDWDFSAASFGPDQGATCYIFDTANCVAAQGPWISVDYPGLPDVQLDGFPYQILSWYCVYGEEDGGSRVNGDPLAGQQVLSTTVALPPPTGHATRLGGPLPTGNGTGLGEL
ncbi:hypothetical protein LTR36_003997 [Oleoguttula mirabilis]|uniref:Uncharacterized protein n=1 Tax=Oleoguttula mirabilis TaxID=1507867 RepID=A0AAV9JHS0_9PEZI|nr:hypothetical protein LTR36_003997 [Oleoguttula mirabilis]